MAEIFILGYSLTEASSCGTVQAENTTSVEYQNLDQFSLWNMHPSLKRDFFGTPWSLYFLEWKYFFQVGDVGGPMFGMKIRLVNWDEGGYKITDKPNPRGELMMGGPSISKGYFKVISVECISLQE